MFYSIYNYFFGITQQPQQTQPSQPIQISETPMKYYVYISPDVDKSEIHTIHVRMNEKEHQEWKEIFDNLPQYITLEQYKERLPFLWTVFGLSKRIKYYKQFKYILDGTFMRCELLLDKNTLTPHYVHKGKSIEVVDEKICIKFEVIIQSDDLPQCIKSG